LKNFYSYALKRGDMSNYVLWGNGPCANRGCEALLRSTVEIINQVDSDAQFISCHGSRQKPFDEKLVQYPNLRHRSPIPQSLSWQMGLRLFERTIGRKFRFESYKRLSPIVLGLGGDNFSTDYHAYPDWYFRSIAASFDRKMPFVVWGVSTGRLNENFEEYGLNCLRKASLITVRESISYSYLLEKGLNNIKLVADPAFVMRASKPKKFDLCSNIFPKDTDIIGVNLSPLIGKFRHESPKTWLSSANKMIQLLADKLDSHILLIPHVFCDGNNDYDFLSMLRGSLNEKCARKVAILDGSNLSAEEIKWVISQVSVFIGARTHATIAALSQSVPTISIGYSTKALGINQDIYGHKNYVIDCNDLSPEVLCSLTEEMVSNKDDIHNLLISKMPEYKKMAYFAGEALMEIGK
jgi:polysaccharide pyruvyl transferase WcaK-like protein